MQNINGEGDILPNLRVKFIVVPMMFMLSMGSLYITSFFHFLFNVRDDFIHACSSLMVAVGILHVEAVYSHFWINRTEFYSLFDEVEDIVYRSE